MTLSAGIGRSFMSASFLQVDAGTELKAVQQLKDSGHTSIFKVFGRYDILSLFDIQDFEDEKIYSSCDGVRVTRALTAYKFITENYTSPDISQWSRKASVLGFVSLELDKWLYSPGSPSGSAFTAITVLIEELDKLAQKDNLNVAIYGGFGRAELYAIVKSSNIEDVWKFTNECRKMICGEYFKKCNDDFNLPVFVRTRTTPCIAYKNIKENEGKVTVDNVDGECTGSIIVNCPPGFEGYIPTYFPDVKGYSYAGLMGDDDGAVFTHKKKNTKEFLEDILNFRYSWVTTHNASIQTRTYLQDSEITSDDNSGKKEACAQGYAVDHTRLKIEIPPVFQKNNPKLANRIRNFIHNLNSYSGNRSYQSAVLCIANYIEYIQQQIDAYKDLSSGRQLISQSKLLEAIETAENGLAQRIDSSFDVTYLDHKIPLPFGDGIFASLIAIEQLINHIFREWSSCHPEYKGREQANGFPTFNDATGFKVRWGETINLPLVAIYDPSDSKGNWNTLTHEISHAIYVRLNILVVHEKDLEKIREGRFRDRAININYDDVFEDEIFELFAHWYDYYHFYDCNINEYIRQMWSSWIQIPVVYINFTEYFFRSLFIYFTHNINKIHEEMTKKDSSQKLKEIFQELWSEHISCIKNQVSGFPVGFIENIETMKKKILTLFHAYMDVLPIFEKYKKEAFRQKINEKYNGFEHDREDILSGQMVASRILNPYVLVKEIISNKLDCGDLSVATSLIMSLKNDAWFYESGSSQ